MKRRAEIAGRRVILFKPLIDDRYGACDVVSRAGVRMSAVPVNGCAELLARARGAEVVGIDEVQAVCHRCGGPATTTQRLVDGRPAPYSGETIVVGALDSCEARCRDYHEASQEDVRRVPLVA